MSFTGDHRPRDRRAPRFRRGNGTNPRPRREPSRRYDPRASLRAR